MAAAAQPFCSSLPPQLVFIRLHRHSFSSFPTAWLTVMRHCNPSFLSIPAVFICLPNQGWFTYKHDSLIPCWDFHQHVCKNRHKQNQQLLKSENFSWILYYRAVKTNTRISIKEATQHGNILDLLSTSNSKSNLHPFSPSQSGISFPFWHLYIYIHTLNILYILYLSDLNSHCALS